MRNNIEAFYRLNRTTTGTFRRTLLKASRRRGCSQGQTVRLASSSSLFG
jgi:hypothetical protein